MPEITVDELYELFLDTLARCNSKLLKQSDEEIEHAMLEEFDIGAHSFLHENSLAKLRSAGLIDDEVADSSKQVRAKWQVIRDRVSRAGDLKGDTEWMELIDVCENVLKRLEPQHESIR
jgi:hypothetical protein